MCGEVYFPCQLVVTESSPAVATTSAGVGVSSTSSWSSGESDGENPLVIDAKQTKVAKSVQLPEKGGVCKHDLEVV